MVLLVLVALIGVVLVVVVAVAVVEVRGVFVVVGRVVVETAKVVVVVAGIVVVELVDMVGVIEVTEIVEVVASVVTDSAAAKIAIEVSADTFFGGEKLDAYASDADDVAGMLVVDFAFVIVILLDAGKNTSVDGELSRGIETF